jgi:hypothetical protein
MEPSDEDKEAHHEGNGQELLVVTPIQLLGIGAVISRAPKPAQTFARQRSSYLLELFDRPT